jgi:hypothetical protein
MNELQIVIVTVLGAALALLGAWLMLFRRDLGANRGKIFGIEFEVSTPALVVLLAGCGLLIFPAFVPHRPGGLSISLWSRSGSVPGVAGPLPWDREVAGEEVEPNDSTSQANHIAVGQLVRGRLDKSGPIDYFAVALPEGDLSEHRLIVRFSGSDGVADAVIWDEKDQELANGRDALGGTLSLKVDSAGAYLIRLQLTSSATRNYELVVDREE